MVYREERNSELYNTLSWMGLLSTEECRIRTVRSNNDRIFEYFDLTYDDIERVGYLYPHFAVPLSYKGKMEVWIGDNYINPASITWIETTNLLYGVLNKHYDEYEEVVRCYTNHGIPYRYSIVTEDDAEYSHVVVIDTTEIQFASIINIEHAAFYISENKIYIPTYEWIDDKRIKFKAPYKHDIDFMICSNLVNVVNVEAGKGVYLDQPHSNRCYHHIFVDHSADYPIDARFYPCVTVDKNCVLRVYSDSYHMILHPDTCRLVLYPEFLEVSDPYNSDDPYLSAVKPVDDIILSSDSDQEVLSKFSNIAKFSYRMWEKYPINFNEQSDFVVCDNAKLRDQTFILRDVYLYDQVVSKICTTVPYEPHRDILFYNGVIFSDYTIRNIKQTSDGKYAENNDGQPTYLIDSSYDMNGFTLVKFNVAEDTTIMNIGEYINTENVARLHFKLNRFYRNLLIVRQELLDQPADEAVRISTVQPTAKDNYLWFELLVNAVPEMFKTRTIDTINLFGLDPNNIPEDVQEGAYALDLDPEGGPESYTEMLMTYFKLGKKKKNYLALQYGEGVDDPRVKVFYDIHFGKEEDNKELNRVLIEDENVSSTETKYEYGVPDDPGTVGKTPGNMYVQTEGSEPPPGQENIDINKISTGPTTPEADEHTLWIETEEPMSQIPAKDALDGETETITFSNVPDTENSESGDYVVDSNDDTFTPEQEGEVEIDDLLDDLIGDVDIEEEAVAEEDDEPEEPAVDLMAGISEAITYNITVDEVENPSVGQIALDDIQFVNSDTGKSITLDEIKAMSTEEKVSIVSKFITDDDTPESAATGDMWLEYLSTADPNLLNTVVYRVLLTAHVYNINQPEHGELALEGNTMPESSTMFAYGEYPQWVDQNQMLIQPHGTDADGNVVPDYAQIREHNVTYIMSLTEPESVQANDLWLKIPAAVLEELIIDVISQTIIEIGAELPEGYYHDDGNEAHATMGFDYDAHDKGTDGLGELFRENRDQRLHKIHYGDVIDTTTLDEGDVWYEFLDEIDNRVVYSDPNTMVIRMDERFILLQFDHNNIQAFAFDDILLNFKGRLGIRYLSIIADLINSGELTLDDINIFYKRLITFGDEFDPKLTRLYTGTSHVVSKPKIDTTDYAIMYSSNIGRFRMDYSDESTTNREREAAYRMCIDFSNRDFAFISDRMLVFINGKFIPTVKYVEDYANKLQILDFNEIIATVDIFYSKKDKPLMDLKKLAYQYWPIADTTESIQRPSEYGVMEPIKVYDYTMKGYYDILLDEYIFNGKLLRILNYLEEHPDEAEAFKSDIIRKFHAISDTDMSMMEHKDARIVIPAQSGDNTPYVIQE